MALCNEVNGRRENDSCSINVQWTFERLNDQTKASFIKTKIHRDSVLYRSFTHNEATASDKIATREAQKRP